MTRPDTCVCVRDRGWHFDETDECLDETTCDCDRYEPKEGQGR